MSFNSAFVQVEIEKNGVVYNSSNFPIFFNSIAEVKAEVRYSEIMKIEIQLTPNFQDAVKILRSGVIGIGKNDNSPDTGQSELAPTEINGAGNKAFSEKSSNDPLTDALAGFATMRVKFVRPGEDIETPWFEGAITQPDVNINGTDIEIILNGYTTGIFYTGPKYNVKIKEGFTAYKLLKDICTLLDYQLIFSDEDTETQQELQKYIFKKGYIRSETPFDTMKWVCSLVKGGFVLGYDPRVGKENKKNPRTLMIRKFGVELKQKPKYRLIQWRNFSDKPEVLELPVFNFSLDSGRALFFNGFAFGAYRMGQDEFKKLVVTDTLDSDALVKDPNESTTQMESSLKNPQLPGYIVPIHEKEEAGKKVTSDEVKGKIEEQHINFRKFSIDTFGVGNIAPLDIVDLVVGDIDELSGSLLVTSVSHTWNSDGWNMTIEGRKKAGLLKG